MVMRSPGVESRQAVGNAVGGIKVLQWAELRVLTFSVFALVGWLVVLSDYPDYPFNVVMALIALASLWSLGNAACRLWVLVRKGRYIRTTQMQCIEAAATTRFRERVLNR
jgi:hypothetical protein